MKGMIEQRNEIDRQIQELYRRRMRLAEMPEEETGKSLREMLEQLVGSTEKSFPEYATVACQGVAGAYSEAAARKLFKYPGIMYFRNFENIFSAIENGMCEYGILPIENSTAGSVNKTYDLMRNHRCYIVRSIRLKIDHELMAAPGTDISQIREIYSHQQAFAQCEKTLRARMPEAKLTICANTAEAARRVAEAGEPGKAAICSPECASLYGLCSLDAGIQDHNSNYTRFICFAKKPQIFAGADKTSFLAVLSNKPGSLYEVLKKFNEVGYNLVKLESRPIPGTEFQFMFYFDFEASVYQKSFIDTMCSLEETCETMEYLGSYSEKI